MTVNLILLHPVQCICISYSCYPQRIKLVTNTVCAILLKQAHETNKTGTDTRTYNF